MKHEITPERWQQIERLYHSALEHDSTQRRAFLQQACAGDDALREEVESLLARGQTTEGLLDHSALGEMAAEMLAKQDGRSLLGMKLGSYQILALLGSGGMGEVYQAHDNKLRRDVAIKVLPAAFMNDAERLARFEREARMLAALNHPNIATIYGLEHSDGVHYLVMELVPGQTLAERVCGGPVPIKETLALAGQIAEALEAAHEKGVIHRDLKPANVKATPQGKVKVLDFGLAKAFAGEGGQDVSHGLTLSEEGRILGTPAYMSPEQARGKPVDKRTDIWAFGCLLYELLTARQAFRGDTLTDTLATVLEREPEWNALPSLTPLEMRNLLRRCLQKDPQRRIHDIADARIEIEETITEPVPSLVETRKSWPNWMWTVAASLVALTLGLGWMIARLRQPAAEMHTVRFTVNPPAGTEFRNGSAISPDGHLLAFVAGSLGGDDRLWIQHLNSLGAHQLPGTDGAAMPFWSPDSRSLGFFAGAKLKRVEVVGGSPAVICDARGGRGGTWNTEGVILFNSVGDGPLLRVSATGGTPVPVTAVDLAQHENSHRWPQFLPDGRHFLYFVRSENNGVYLGSLSRPQEKIRLLTSSTNAVYAPGRDKQTGYLLWVRDGALMAQLFDPGQGRLRAKRSSWRNLSGSARLAGRGGAKYRSQLEVLFFTAGRTSGVIN